MKKEFPFLLLTMAMLVGCQSPASGLSSTSSSASESSSTRDYVQQKRSNPGKIVHEGKEYPLNAADPDCIKGEDGFFYLYTTQNFCHRGEEGYGYDRCPIYRSRNLSDWEYVGSVFEDSDFDESQWDRDYGIWAPCVYKVGDMYNCYYAVGYSSGARDSTGIGVAQAPTPAGPWTHYGKILDSGQIGVENSIDPFVMEVDSSIYLFFGSFLGIYAVELTIDGISLMDGESANQHLIEVSPPSGSFDLERNFEATFILPKDGKYYIFGSKGTCCSGTSSTYYVVSGVSDSPFGPYCASDGKEISSSDSLGGDLVLAPSAEVMGVGHNSVVRDDAGDYWIVYHGYDLDGPYPGERTIFADKLLFSSQTGMPYVEDLKASDKVEMDGPRLFA